MGGEKLVSRIQAQHGLIEDDNLFAAAEAIKVRAHRITVRAQLTELDIVTDPDIKKVIEDEGVCLVGYRDLRNFQRKLRAEEESAEEE